MFYPSVPELVCIKEIEAVLETYLDNKQSCTLHNNGGHFETNIYLCQNDPHYFYVYTFLNVKNTIYYHIFKE